MIMLCYWYVIGRKYARLCDIISVIDIVIGYCYIVMIIVMASLCYWYNIFYIYSILGTLLL